MRVAWICSRDWAARARVLVDVDLATMLMGSSLDCAWGDYIRTISNCTAHTVGREKMSRLDKLVDAK